MAGIIKTYRTYMFVNKDPAIDELRTIVQDSEKSYGEISEDSGVAESTLWSWFHGDTRRPQNASLEAVGRSLGHIRKFVPMTSKERSKAKPKPARKQPPARAAALH